MTRNAINVDGDTIDEDQERRYQALLEGLPPDSHWTGPGGRRALRRAKLRELRHDVAELGRAIRDLFRHGSDRV